MKILKFLAIAVTFLLGIVFAIFTVLLGIGYLSMVFTGTHLSAEEQTEILLMGLPISASCLGLGYVSYGFFSFFHWLRKRWFQVNREEKFGVRTFGVRF